MKTNRRTWAAVALGALLVSMLSLAPTARAEVVYTPLNITITGSGSIKLDLNQDRVKDFVLKTAIQGTACSIGGGVAVYTTIIPKAGAGVVVSQTNTAALLGSGVSIDSSQTFSNVKAGVMGVRSCSDFSKQVFGYLGLEIQLNSQTYYGWANVGIRAYYHAGELSVTTAVTGIAYESNPGVPIQTGQTSSNVEGAGNIPHFVAPDSANHLTDDRRGAF